MLQLTLEGIGGRNNISVTTWMPTNPDFVDFEWPYEFPGMSDEMAAKLPRNVAMVPVRIHNPGPDNWVAPVRYTVGDPRFMIWSKLKLPMLRPTFAFELLRWDDTPARYVTANVPLIGQNGEFLIKPDGTVGLNVGESVYAHFNYAFLDKKGVAIDRSGYDQLGEQEGHFLTIIFDPNRILGLGDQTPVTFRRVRIGTNEMQIVT